MAEESKVHTGSPHRLVLVGRGSMEITGVTDVISFDEQTVALSTVCGGLEIVGSGLHIHVLSMEQGVVTLDGAVDSVSYFEAAEERATGGFFSKLFH